MGLITENWIMDIFYILVTLVTAFYLYAKRTYSYWERKNFKTLPNNNYLMGHFKDNFLQKKSFANLMLDFYNQTTEKFIGLYSTFRPVLLIRDPELIRSVLVKDFNNFVNRSGPHDEVNDPLSANLFTMPGSKWRNLRGKLSPTFTSGKLKIMFSTFVASGAPLQKHLEKSAANGEIIDMRDLAARYTTNNIASIAFGIEVDTIADPNNDFRVYGRKVVEPSTANAIRTAIAVVMPKLLDILPIRSTDPGVEKFIFSIVKQNLEYREKNNVTRKDFFQLLIQLHKGTFEHDGQTEKTIQNEENKATLTFNEMAAQAFLFFVAGYETSASTLSGCLLELSKQPELQKRVHNEIDCVFEKNNGELTYESLAEMKLLDNCIDETLRLYPVVSVLNRIAMNDYRIPGTKNVIEKGTEVFIPVIGLHHDEQYYPDPLQFKPERFSDELNDKYQAKRPYLPFGDGPRNCVGMRLGKMQAKIGLVKMLEKFSFSLISGDDHKDVTDYEPKSFITIPRGGIHLKVTKRSEIA